jgi:hypothetical protein
MLMKHTKSLSSDRFDQIEKINQEDYLVLNIIFISLKKQIFCKECCFFVYMFLYIFLLLTNNKKPNL